MLSRRVLSVALTEGKSLFVFWDSQGYANDKYEVFDDFGCLTESEELPAKLKAFVAYEIGVKYTQFLDI